MKTKLTTFSLLLAFLGFWACKDSNSIQETTEVIEQDSSISEPVVETQDIQYSVDSTQLRGYLVYDASSEDKRPGILVIHEWWGHNNYVRQRARQLAELGYVAFALDMYGDGKLADHPDDAGKFAGMVMSNLPSAKARFEAAMEQLKSHPLVDADNIAAIGYCFGGSVALSMANAGYDLDAVAAFHSGVQLPIAPSEDIKAKVLVANGADDPFISEESVIAFKQAMDKVGADYNYISYPGVVHSFTSPMADSLGQKFELPLKYNAEADADSWNKMQELFGSAFETE